jgi:hypothetical protein
VYVRGLSGLSQGEYTARANTEPTIVRFRFAAMSDLEIVFHSVVLVIAILGVPISLAGIAFWWVSRKMKRLS